MPLYKYNGIDKNGNIVKDTYTAKDEVELQTKLASQGIKITKYKTISEKRTSSFFSVSSKVSNKEFVAFTQQLSIMIKAGVTIADSLNTLRNQSFSIYFKNIISDIYEDVLKGVYLSTAFSKHPKEFPSFFCSMVYVGELSGNLSEVLVKSATYYQNDQKVKRKIKSALIYPVFLLVVVVAIFFLLMILVVPEFTDMIGEFGGEVPALTKAVQALSNFVINNLLWIIIILAALIMGGYFFFSKTKKGKRVKDYLGIHLLIIGKVNKSSITSRFCTALQILLMSGLNVLDCLKAMPKIIDNTEFDKQFAGVIKDVNDGKKLSISLKQCKILPKMLIQMTAVGENTSSLTEVYKTVGDYYQDELEATIARATGMLEPIVIIILGVLVLVVILAVMMPLFSLINTIQ